jgi:hypothetical protein
MLLGEISSGDDLEIRPYLLPDSLRNCYGYPDFRRVNCALHGKAPSRELELSHVASSKVLNTSQSNVIRFIDNQDVFRFLSTNESTSILYTALVHLYFAVGIPLVYYGTEQEMSQHNSSLEPEGEHNPADPANRENMFRKKSLNQFSSSASKKIKLFDNKNPAFLFIQKLNKLRKAEIALRRGTHVCRYSDASGPGIYAWSRIWSTYEVVIVLNTSAEERHVELVLDSALSPIGCEFRDAFDDYYTCYTRCSNLPIPGSIINVTVPPRGPNGFRVLSRAVQLDL